VIQGGSLHWNLIPGIAAAYIAFSFLGFGGSTISFEGSKPGSLPPYWSAMPRWQIRLDDTAPSRPYVFVHLPPAAGEAESSLAIYDKVVCRDGDLSVKFKIAPTERRVKTVGMVWRYQDPRNYYLLQFSVDEKNVELFHVQNGQQRPIRATGGKPGVRGVSHDLRANQWYVARVVFRGPAFHVLFGNRELFGAVDDSLTSAGKTGLWTKDGTAASFDDFRIDKKG
jgi:hypothetical protein